MSPPDRPADTIRIMSWNIHGTIGRGRKANRQRTLEEIGRIRPDILVLQEVDERTRLGRPAGAFDFFRAGLTERLLAEGHDPSDHAVDVRTGGRRDCECGNLLWSRFPVRASRIIPLPGPDIERRKVIEVELHTGSAPLRILGTHFALLPTTRLKQARTVRDRIVGAPSGSCAGKVPTPTIVLGDLNEWTPRGWVHAVLSEHLPNVVAPKTWPERFAIAPLDRLYASREIEIVASHADARAGQASDHRPIVVDFRIGP
ncbi:endonuclease/exonuclease/phosphatase family protein [Fulvimarina sp. 2208YS6-2-32]|uniref:Endonuclease/exonuclease/phosphatase family protein n=1 Tax=Fulvimarina uroteuthidis TaxID=3098149 RepID=A0ABU5I717_9HYPH|nr:endonuclease/exonuclease/phosphatase family protein [Fulvimarina sp. 2208YS6-2-32]MDY8111179.1 endonuclease/exonuclease/phosphatase family protein [Fulvimarina sp. 2208YS6-2-32]